jgi:amino acid adenylation domain-containing protein
MAAALTATGVLLARLAGSAELAVWATPGMLTDAAEGDATGPGPAADCQPVLPLPVSYRADQAGVDAVAAGRARAAEALLAAADPHAADAGAGAGAAEVGAGGGPDAAAGVRVVVARAGEDAPDWADVVLWWSAAALTVEHRVAAVDPDLADQLLPSLVGLLGALGADPGCPVGDLPLLAAADRRTVQAGWSVGRRSPVEAATVPELVARQAARAPAATAVVQGDRRLSYRELDQAANRLAHRLRSLGVRPGELVAVCTSRSPEMIVGMLGVLVAGAAYLPVDPGHPRKRLAFLLDDGGCRVLLTERGLRDRLPDTGATVVELDAEPARPGPATPAEPTEPAGPPQPGAGPDELAYVIHTSGSTGLPKGVRIPHRGLTNLVRWHQDTYRLGPGDRTTQIAATAFDASVWEIWPTLAAGAELHLADDAARGTTADLVRWLVDSRITVAFLPTPLAELALAEPWPAECALRYLLTGGDTLHRPPPSGLPFVLVNHYGPTENSVVTTAVEIPAGPTAPGARAGAEPTPPPIGRPIHNTRAYVLDERMQPVPAGVPGELYVGGAGLALGYHNRPELTESRFVPDPFGAGRLYRSGDRARWRPDGCLEFLGRVDDQVKLRGFRIEPGEIEAALRAHPGIAEAAVALRTDQPGQPQLVGYVVARPQRDPAPHPPPGTDPAPRRPTGTDPAPHPPPGTDPGPDAAADPGGLPGPAELRAWLAETLPAHLVPAVFVELPALPLTRNGKLDRAALPAPDPTRPAHLGPVVPPAGDLESAVAQLWESVLGVTPVGALDDFFVLGGDSLAATRVVARLRETLRVRLPLASVFAEPTVRGLAAALTRATGPAPAPLDRADRGVPAPLTEAQQQLWLLHSLDRTGITYNISLTVDLRGRLDAGALRAALTDLVARHEGLRTRLPVVDGWPLQVVGEPAAVDLPVRTEPAADALGQQVVAASRQPFDLAAGPPFRVALWRRSADQHVLLLVIHHAMFDGWSLGVFCRDLAALYQARRGGAELRLPELPVQCVDLAAHQARLRAGDTRAADVDYWRTALAGAPPVLELPTDFPRPAQVSTAGARATVWFEPDLTDRVSAFARATGGTVFSTLFSAFSTLLSRSAGTEDVVVGSPVAARLRPELEPLIGCFINTLPLRVDLAGEPGFAELAARVRAVVMAAHEHQELPFNRIVDAVRPDRSTAHSPIHQVVFALEDAHPARFDLAGVSAEVTEVDFGSSRADLGVSVTPVAGRLRVCAEYRTDLFTAGTVTALLNQFGVLLGHALAEPDRPVTQLPLLTDEQRQRMLFDWNDTAAEFPADVAVHELVERQVDLRPDAAAVVFEDEATLTYRELDGRANQLAHHLRGLGVGRDTRVAVCLQRSPEMVVAVLAVLKAGGCYLPLDPANPVDRLAFMVADAQAPVVLTQRALRGSVSTSDATVVELDTDWPRVAARPATRPGRLAGPTDLAYVIYTSGSAGTPKGVMVEHRSLGNFVSAEHRMFEMGPHDDVLQFASLSFDVSVGEIFGALTCGARLHLARQETLLSVPELTRFMQQHRISMMDMAPAMMALLPGDAFPALRVAFVGGEAFSGDLVNRWSVPGRRFFNGYGPTEGTVTMIVEECTGTDWDQSPPIGRPVQNMRAYVLDQHRQPVPVGVPGELYIGGVMLARGYLNRPELTAAKFVRDPFHPDPTQRLYRTGDLVRFRPDGRLDFLGRIDDQVKLRGFRIELGEVEAVLAAHPDVADAAVLLREDTPGARKLVGYVAAPATGARARPEPAELRGHLADRLPPYMVPAALVVMDALPLTASGKVDRRALPRPDGADLAGAAAVPPRNRRERTLAEIWARLLDVPKVGVHDNFFALGGHSILGLQLVREIRTAFGVDVSIRDVFEHATVAALAAVVERAMLARLADRSAAAGDPHPKDAHG